MANVDLEALRALREPFLPAQIGKLEATAKRPELEFVGHAAVTDRLNAVLGQDWSYTVDETFSVQDVVWIRGTMTIGGVSRVEFGDGSDPKSAIGNFIRRAAMRWGVAIDLWSRQELEEISEDGGHVSPETNTGVALGKASAGHRGEGGTVREQPSSPYPIDPLECSHRYASGRWVTWISDTEGREVCPKCGTPKVTAMEGTTADLGPA